MVCNYENGCSGQKSCSDCRSSLMVLVGIIGGIIFAAAGILLFINGLITVPGYAGWVALIAALVYLFVLIASAVSSDTAGNMPCCIRKNTGSLFFGIAGTILAGILVISTELAAASVFSIILVGLLFFFFAYMIITTLALIRCVTD